MSEYGQSNYTFGNWENTIGMSMDPVNSQQDDLMQRIYLLSNFYTPPFY